MSKKFPLVSLVIILGIAAVAFGIWFIGSNGKKANSDKISVAATIFPLFDITKNIAGDRLDVLQVLPNGASPHTYEPKPKDVEAISDVSLVFTIGHDLDGWVSKMITNDAPQVVVDRGVTMIELSEEGHEHEHEEESHEHEHEEEGYEHEHEEEGHEHEGIDPHYWLSPTNALIIAENIKNELVKLDPDNAISYEENYQSYILELQELIAFTENAFDAEDKIKIITFHDGFNYFAQDAGIKILTTIEPFPGKEPTAKYLEELAKVIEEYQVSVLFKEPQLSSKSLLPFVEQHGVSVYDLDPIGGVENRQSYVDLIKYNVNQIKTASE